MTSSHQLIIYAKTCSQLRSYSGGSGRHDFGVGIPSQCIHNPCQLPTEISSTTLWYRISFFPLLSGSTEPSHITEFFLILFDLECSVMLLSNHNIGAGKQRRKARNKLFHTQFFSYYSNTFHFKSSLLHLPQSYLSLNPNNSSSAPPPAPSHNLFEEPPGYTRVNQYA